MVEDLVGSGWEKKTAKAVVDLNEEWFEIEREENPARFDRQVAALRRLGRHRELRPFLAAHPHVAGLLAEAVEPERIANSFPESGANDSDANDFDRIASYYVQYPSPDAASKFAEAAERHRKTILEFSREGLIGGEAIFLFDRGDPAINAYDDWLRKELETQAYWSEDQRASFVQFVLRQGPGIRKRMRESPEFGRRFQDDLWRKLADIVSSDRMYEKYIDDDRIWDLLSLEEGKRLLRDNGALALDLYYGYPEIRVAPYPEHLRGRVAELLALEDETTVRALIQCRGEQQFHELIARNLTTNALRSAFEKLVQAGPEYPRELDRFARIKSDAGLIEELGPPTAGIKTWLPFYYTVYEVPKKLIQRRDVTYMEWLSAVADPAFLVIDITTGGGSAAVRTAVANGVITKTEKQAGKVLATTLKRTGLELAEKQIPKVGGKIGEKEAISWTITGTISGVQQSVRTAFGKATTFEITKPVQFLFRYGGVDREIWKRVGLEARLFMRRDARVFIRLSKVPVAVLGTRGAAFFERTAGDLTLGAAAESGPGQETQKAVASPVAQQLGTWKRQISAWWLLNASISPDDALKEKGVAQ